MPEREVGCANIGSGKRFADAAECTVATGRKADAEIGASPCPSGVVESSLERCLSELRSLVCSIPLESPTQLPTCRRSVLSGVDVQR